MSNKGNRCLNRDYFMCYYVKSVKLFKKTEFGYCIKDIGTVKKDGCCAAYAPKKCRRTPKRSLLYYLSDLLTEISQIRVILEEEAEQSDEV